MFLELGLVGTSVVLLVSVVVVLVYLGFFERVRVETGNPPLQLSGRVLAYKAHRDTYSGIGFHFTKQYNFTAVQSIEVRRLLERAKAIGIYYDSPTDKKQRCRFLVGLLLDDQSDCPDVKECLELEGYRFATLPDIDHVVHTTFPYRSYAAASIANKKVYPVINEYLKVTALTHVHSHQTQTIHVSLIRAFTSRKIVCVRIQRSTSMRMIAFISFCRFPSNKTSSTITSRKAKTKTTIRSMKTISNIC
jgi:hypothetical protein